MANRARPNAFRPNTSGVPEPAPPAPSGVTAPRWWRLEHRDKDGVLLSGYCSAYTARVQAEVNSPWLLSCEFPYSAEVWGWCAFPNQLWMYDDTDTLKQKFFFRERARSIKGGVRSISAKLVSLMGLLAYDTVEADVEYTTVAGALSGVIASQQNTPAVSIGDVTLAYAAGSMTINLQNKTALQALYQVYEESGAGGVFWVDPATLELEWERDAGPFAGNIAATAINVAEIEIREDFGQLATRVVAQGQGIESDTRLVAELDDETAQAAYGIRSAIVSNRDIRTAGTLNAYAESQLSMLHVPRQSISVDMVDLSKVSASYGASEIQVGQWLRVVDTVFGVEFRALVHSIEFDLSNPGDIKVEIGNAIAGREEWVDLDGNLQAPGTPLRNASNADGRDILDVLADAVERGIDDDNVDPGFDYSLRNNDWLQDQFDPTNTDGLLYEGVAGDGGIIDSLLADPSSPLSEAIGDGVTFPSGTGSQAFGEEYGVQPLDTSAGSNGYGGPDNVSAPANHQHGPARWVEYNAP